MCVDYVPAKAELLSYQGRYNYVIGKNSSSSVHLVILFHMDVLYVALDEGKYQSKFGSHCKVGAVSHYQIWKNGFYTYTTRTPSLDTHIVLFTFHGFIPLRLKRSDEKKIFRPGYSVGRAAVEDRGKSTGGGLLSYGELTGALVPYGRMSPFDLSRLSSVSADHAGRTLARLAHTNTMTDRHQLRSHKEDSHTDESIATAYCAGFQKDLKKCVCPLLSSEILVLKKGLPPVSSSLENAITLVTIAWAQEVMSDSMKERLSSWPSTLGPQVCHHTNYVPISIVSSRL